MKKFIWIVICLLLFSTVVFALDDNASHDITLNVVDVCIIDLNSTATITLNIVAPAQGGQNPVGETDSSKLLQYTSLTSLGNHRVIAANWAAMDSAPVGTSLRLEVTSVPAGCGTAGAQITLSNTAQFLISSIGSCVTGTGSNGARLLYTFNVDNVSQLVVGDTSTVTVIFTLSDVY